jgi:hypothetical protein
MLLEKSLCLCYIENNKLFEWIEKKQLKGKNFFSQKIIWKKEIDKNPGFFSDTELLLVTEDILLLQVSNANAASFLAKNYLLSYQLVCQRVFSEKKNIILISQDQWNKPDFSQKSIVLLKDIENIKKSLATWLEGFAHP